MEGAVSRAFEHRPELAQAEQGDRALRGPARLRAQPAAARARRRLPLRAKRTRGRSEPRLACRFASTRPRACANPPATRSRATSTTASTTTRTIPSTSQARASSIPIPNTTARANASSSELELSRAQTQQAAPRAADHARGAQGRAKPKASQEGIVAARSARERPRSSCAPSRSGSSTASRRRSTCSSARRTLVERERDEIGAFRAYRLSVTALDRAQGTILRNRNIDIADVAPLR